MSAFIFLLLLINTHSVVTKTINCTKTSTWCECGALDAECKLNCIGDDYCTGNGYKLQCTPNQFCGLTCEGTNACRGAILTANGAINVNISCGGKNTTAPWPLRQCSGSIFNCGSGHCSIRCKGNADDSCLGVTVNTNNAKSFVCDGSHCPQSLINLEYTAAPTTSEPTIFTSNPTHSPTFVPSRTPTKYPTNYPYVPTTNPTYVPTHHPTTDPVAKPTYVPTINPSFDPTSAPTFDPSIFPTFDPSLFPSFDPTSAPTFDPTLSHRSTSLAPVFVTTLNIAATASSSQTTASLKTDTTQETIDTAFPEPTDRTSSTGIMQWEILVPALGVIVLVVIVSVISAYKYRRQYSAVRTEESEDDITDIET